MKMRDIGLLIDGIAPVIVATFAKALAPINARLAAAEEKLAEPKVPFVDVGALVAEAVKAALADQPKVPTAEEVAKHVVMPIAEEVAARIPAPVNGKDADPEVVAAMIKSAAEALVAPMQAAIDATLAGLPKVPTAEEVAALVQVPTVEEIAKLVPPGKDGIAPTAEEVAALIPVPQNGKDGIAPTAEEIAKLVPAGEDGVGLAGALIDSEGALVVTLTDGAVVKLGRVVGKNGEPGKDGLGFDDLSVFHDGARSFKLVMARGEQVKETEFKLPVVLDRGVFKDGTEYETGDGTTWQGSFWIAQSVTKDKPGTSSAWRLAVKKGRDGRDGDAQKTAAPVKVKL